LKFRAALPFGSAPENFCTNRSAVVNEPHQHQFPNHRKQSQFPKTASTERGAAKFRQLQLEQGVHLEEDLGLERVALLHGDLLVVPRGWQIVALCCSVSPASHTNTHKERERVIQSVDEAADTKTQPTPRDTEQTQGIGTGTG
jgi:hypothetical protein